MGKDSVTKFQEAMAFVSLPQLRTTKTDGRGCFNRNDLNVPDVREDVGHGSLFNNYESGMPHGLLVKICHHKSTRAKAGFH